jgi:uncharacterized membrane protein
VAALVSMLVIGIVNMLVDVLLAIMLMGMLMFIISVTAHFSFTSDIISLAYFVSTYFKEIQL